MVWRIYYRYLVVEGESEEQWDCAPDEGVQVVVLLEPYPDGRRPWCGVDDRQLWTGEEEYSLFGWGSKRGLLIPDVEYFAIWNRACRE